MCIAIFKPAGAPLPTMEALQNSFDNNPDGAGFMYLQDGAVCIRKGYMTWGDFEAAYHKHAFTEADTVGLHFRITTAGGTSKGNCHPFPLSPDERSLKSQCITAPYAMMHNGIMGRGEHGLSDTQVFVRDIASHPLFAGRLWFDKEVQAFLAHYSMGSRLCFVHGDGRFFLSGDWTEENGVFYSNTSHRYARHAMYHWGAEDDYGLCDFRCKTCKVHKVTSCPECLGELVWDKRTDEAICKGCGETFQCHEVWESTMAEAANDGAIAIAKKPAKKPAKK